MKLDEFARIANGEPDPDGSPATATVRARDVVPYHYALWSSIGGGDPFANQIVSAGWSDDGTQVRMMLDSHNFLFIDPDEVLELIPVDPGPRLGAKYEDWSLGPRPTPEPPDPVHALARELADCLEGLGANGEHGMPDLERCTRSIRARPGLLDRARALGLLPTKTEAPIRG